MSGEGEGRAFPKPFRKPDAKPFGKPFGKPYRKPAGGFGPPRGGDPDARPAGGPGLRPWKARRAEGDDFPRPPLREEREERGEDAAPPVADEPGPHAGKFYEPFVKRPRAKPPAREAREEREDSRSPRPMPFSERPQRIPSSASTRSFAARDERPRPYSGGRDDSRDRGNPMRTSEGREQLGASSGFRRNFNSGERRDERRDDYQRGPARRDDRHEGPGERPFGRGPSFGRRDERGDNRPSRDNFQRDERSFSPRPGAFAPRREDERRQDERRPWQDRPNEGYRRAPERGAPHMERRVIRSEGARADQSSAPPPRPEVAGPLSAARELAVRVLLRRLQGNVFVEDLFEEAVATTKMRADDRRLAQEMVYGCVRWQGTLDWLVARNTEDRPQIPQVQVFLRLGLYQLFFLDRIPPHAACFETVEIAKRHGFVSQSNFINAILRRCDRERSGVRQSLIDLKTALPATGYSHPEWLVQKWTERWGADDTRRLLDWNNTAPPTCARVNTLKTDSTQLIERWRLKEHVEYDFIPCPWADADQVFVLKVHPSLAGLGSFRDGWFYVQDPSTLLAVQALDPWAGESILDLCAAPGGKTAYIAQKMENDGELLACDTSPDRLRLVTENCVRLGVTCVTTLALGDQPEVALAERKFDKILVDAPCSNTGVLRRRLDLRWRLRPEEFAKLRETQLRLLALAAAHLKPGGTLVYSTCSLEPEENSEVVKDFLAAHPQFQLESERELLPFRDGVDGAYVAKLKG